MKLTNLIRAYLVGPAQDFTFRPVGAEKLSLSGVDETHLYIHIPFCKSMCPYCPYNRIRYDKTLSDQYFKALSVEIDRMSSEAEGVSISSVYIGGGTPTVDMDALESVVRRVRKKFKIKGDIAIETTLADIDDNNLERLKDMQITMLSIGVQSFNQKNLKFLGRNYDASEIRPAIERAKKYEFESINKVRMPRLLTRRRLYRTVYDYFSGRDYDFASVWSFKKNNEKRYSSVTRQTYLGLGAGAGSRQKELFYFNTFSVPEYNKALLEEERLPVALAMPISSKLSDWYWLYWKLYETKFSIAEFERVEDRKMRFIFRLFYSLRFFNAENGLLQLTERGSFWIHLIQNQFMLNYINKVWSIMKVEAYPKEIRI